jgi:hypothetical protein
MTDKMTTTQFFEAMLRETLGHGYVEKQGSVWPPKGTYEITFGAIDESIDEDRGVPECFIPGYCAIRVPYTIDKAALPTLRGFHGEYVFWFSSAIGAEIAADNLAICAGLPRPPFNSKIGPDWIIETAKTLNGQKVRLERDVVTTKKGKRAPKDRFFSLATPKTKQISADSEPSPAELVALADDDDMPF